MQIAKPKHREGKPSDQGHEAGRNLDGRADMVPRFGPLLYSNREPLKDLEGRWRHDECICIFKSLALWQ